MKVEVIVAVFTLLAYTATAQLNQAYATVQRPKQLSSTPLTTSMPYDYTTISLSPKTSISVEHSVVRNQPAYPFPYTENTLLADGSEDTSYYYTYEESSEERTKKPYMMSPPTTTSKPSINKPTIRSFWNSQKALLDARRKESSQKFVTTYTRSTEKPKIEFKVREKPKFGLSSKAKFGTTSTESSTEDVPTTTMKSVKYNSNNVNNKVEDKEENTKSSSKDLENGLPNQITGRVGELPLSTSLAAPVQQPFYQSALAGSSKQSKFDDSMVNTKFVDDSRQSVTKSYKPMLNLENSKDSKPMMDLKKQASLLASILQQQPNTISNPTSIISTSKPPMDPSEFLKRLLNQQTVPTTSQPRLNLNRQPLVHDNSLLQNQFFSNMQNLNNPSNNLNPLPSNQYQQTSNIYQQTSNLRSQTNNISPSSGNTIMATIPLGNSVQRAGDLVTNNNPGSSLLSRLGSLALNLGGDSPGVSNYVLGRDGGGSGLQFNLGPIPDPITILLKLLSLIPRPLLDLNGKVFFGVELGKNAGLTTKPIG